MGYGLEVYNQAGKCWATPETQFMHMRQKVRFNGSGNPTQVHELRTDCPSWKGFMAFYKADNSNGMGFQVNFFQRDNVWWIKVERAESAPGGWFYCFSTEVPPADAGWGIEIYGEDGTRRYSSSTKPLQIQSMDWAFNVQDIQRNLPHGVASLVTTIGAHSQPLGGSMQRIIMFHKAIASGNSLFRKLIKGPIFNSDWPPNWYEKQTQVHYINTDMYD